MAEERRQTSRGLVFEFEVGVPYLNITACKSVTVEKRLNWGSWGGSAGTKLSGGRLSSLKKWHHIGIEVRYTAHLVTPT